jgi:hypothetical protein
VCVCVGGGYLSGRDYVMECARGRVESRRVRIVGYSLLSTVLWLVCGVGGIFVCEKLPSSSFLSFYYMVLGVLNFSFAATYLSLAHILCTCATNTHMKRQCFIWFAESESILRLQRYFCHLCGRGLTVGKAIRRWFARFKWPRIVERSKPPARPLTSPENDERVTIKMSCSKG